MIKFREGLRLFYYKLDQDASLYVYISSGVMEGKVEICIQLESISPLKDYGCRDHIPYLKYRFPELSLMK
jgi:hypothetical protein